MTRIAAAALAIALALATSAEARRYYSTRTCTTNHVTGMTACITTTTPVMSCVHQLC